LSPQGQVPHITMDEVQPRPEGARRWSATSRQSTFPRMRKAASDALKRAPNHVVSGTMVCSRPQLLGPMVLAFLDLDAVGASMEADPSCCRASAALLGASVDVHRSAAEQ
jgi:hypothetical protein